MASPCFAGYGVEDRIGEVCECSNEERVVREVDVLHRSDEKRAVLHVCGGEPNREVRLREREENYRLVLH